jgi:hypothetical protein
MFKQIGFRVQELHNDKGSEHSLEHLDYYASTTSSCKV